MLAEKSNFTITRMVRLLEVSRSGFYAWLNRAPSKRAVRMERIEQKVTWFHGESDEVSGAPKILADTLGIPTYFADPYSAWQRGTNEHFNGRIRKYLPKGTSFENLTQVELNEFITEINNRPRKILSWATPAEVFQELCSQ